MCNYKKCYTDNAGPSWRFDQTPLCTRTTRHYWVRYNNLPSLTVSFRRFCSSATVNDSEPTYLRHCIA